jgi:tetratricopeptide (TPR) repeat protein
MTDKGFSFGGPSGPVLFKDRITCPHCKKEVVNKERRTARGGYPPNCPHCGADFVLSWWFEDEQKKVFLDPVLASESYRQGTLKLEAGNFQEAIKYYEEAISIAPDHASAWNNKGLALESLGRTGDAIECFDRAIAIDPSVEFPWRNKGLTLLKLGQSEEAMRCIDKAISIDAGDGVAWALKGTALLVSGRKNEGIECLRKADSLGHAPAREALASLGVSDLSKEKAGKPRWKFWQRR